MSWLLSSILYSPPFPHIRVLDMTNKLLINWNSTPSLHLLLCINTQFLCSYLFKNNPEICSISYSNIDFYLPLTGSSNNCLHCAACCLNISFHLYSSGAGEQEDTEQLGDTLQWWRVFCCFVRPLIKHPTSIERPGLVAAPWPPLDTGQRFTGGGGSR